MTNYVEQATLILNDKTSANARKINRALGTLAQTMKKMESASKGIKLPAFKEAGNYSRVAKNLSAVAKAQTELVKAASSKRPNFRVPNVPQGKVQQLRELTKALEAYNRAAGRTPRPPNLGGRGGGSGGAGVSPSGVGNAGTPGMFGININPLKLWTTSFMYRLSYTIERSIITGFRDGIKETDTSQNRLRLLGYDEKTREGIETSARSISRDNPVLNRSEVRTLYAELGPILGKNPLDAEPLIKMAAEYTNILVGMGKDTTQATQGVRALFKTLDNINRLQDDAGGIDKDAAKYFEVIMQETIRAGGFISPNQLNTASVYARTYGKTMSPEGFRVLIANLESMGRIAGTSLNRFVETLSGTTTKKALAEQAEWGLITTKEITTGGVGGKPKTQIVRDETVNEELLRRDPNQWVVENLIPKLLDRGVDLNSPEQTAKVLAPLFGSIVAKDMALNLASWQGEFTKAVEASLNTVTKAEEVSGIINESPVVAFNSTMKQTEQLLGDVGRSLSSVFIPALQTTRDIIMGLSEFVAGPSGDGSATNASLLAGGSALAIFGGAKGLEKLLGISGLRIAGIELQGSAAALTRAAVALGAGGAGGGATPASKSKTGAVAGGIGMAAGMASRGLGWLGLAVLADQAVQAVSPGYAEFRKDLDSAVDRGQKQNTEFINRILFKQPESNAPGESVKREIAQLEENARRAGQGTGPGSPYGDMIANKQAELATVTQNAESIQAGLEAAFTTGASSLGSESNILEQVFSQGATNLQAVGPTIDAAAASFGPRAGEGILATAGQWGSAAAQAFMAQAQGLKMELSTPALRSPDVGVNPPLD